MKNHIQSGNNITFTAAAAVISGQGVLAGALFGIAATNAAIGEDFEAETVGVFDIDKTAAQAFAFGAPVYWNDTTKLATSSAAGNKLIGAATLAAAATDATVRVRLNGISV
jgi:predicted RecA/RadA family phage recombinase